MRRHCKLLVTIFVAALTLGTSVGTASANNLSISNRNIRAVWRPLTFSDGASGITIRCDVTLEGSFHANTIRKVLESLIGYITAAAVGRPCAGEGEAWILNGVESLEGGGVPDSLPWHIRYAGFVGTLPVINGIRFNLVLVSLLLTVIGVFCLYRSTMASPAKAIAVPLASGQIGGLKADETVLIPRASGSIFCPSSGRFAGTADVRLLGSTTTLIFIRLI